MKFLSAISLFILILSCKTSTFPPPEPVLGKEFQIKSEQELAFSEENLTIEFIGVEEDSRCPEGVVCVWAGNARIFLRLNQERLELNSTLDPKEQRVDSLYFVRFVSLDPYPVYGETIDPEDYVATLIINRK